MGRFPAPDKKGGVHVFWPSHSQIYPYKLLPQDQNEPSEFSAPCLTRWAPGTDVAASIHTYISCVVWKLSDTTVQQTPGLPFPTPSGPPRRFQGQERAEAEVRSLGSGATVANVHRQRISPFTVLSPRGRLTVSHQVRIHEDLISNCFGRGVRSQPSAAAVIRANGEGRRGGAAGRV